MVEATTSADPKTGESSRLARQAKEILFWRVIGTALSAVGTLWSARCLGVENLGISGLVLNVANNAVFIIGLQMNMPFVRLFKESDCKETALELSRALTSFRFFASCSVVLLTAAVVPFLPLPPGWSFPIWAALPLVVLGSLDVGWLLQAQENLPVQQRVTTLRNALTAAGYLLFFRPGVAAGWDLVLASVVAGICSLVSWRAAYGSPLGVVSWRRIPRALEVFKASKAQAVSATAAWGYYSVQMPLIGRLSSLFELGLVRTAQQVAQPIERTLRMFNTLLFPRFVSWHKDGGADSLWLKQRRLVVGAIMAAPAVGLTGYLTLPWVFRHLLGESFEAAGHPTALFLAGKCLIVAQENLTMAMWARRKDGLVTRLLLGMLGIITLLLWLLVPSFGALGAAWACLLCDGAAVAWLYWRCRADALQASEERSRASD